MRQQPASSCFEPAVFATKRAWPSSPKLCGLAGRLAEYEGRYTAKVIRPFGPPDQILEQAIELKAPDGELRVTGDIELSLAFYRDEYVLATNSQGETSRSDFLRGPDSRIAWLRDSGRLWARQG
jgi:hypothetical protein